MHKSILSASDAGRGRIVVLGAGGFLGRRVVAALTQTEGSRVVAVGRSIGASDFPAGLEKVAVNAADPLALAGVLAGAQGVVNCIAGESKDIVSSGLAIADIVSQMPIPARVVNLSSLAVYGAHQGLVDENSPLREDYTDYGTAKVTVDRHAASRPFVVTLRPGIIYGPGSAWWTERIARLLLSRRLGHLGAAGEGYCNLVHVDDVARAVVQALSLPGVGGQVFNLGSAEPPTWNAYFEAFGRVLGVAPVPRVGSLRLKAELALLGPLLKVRERMVGNDDVPAIRPWLTDLCRLPIRMQVRKAESMLGLKWLPLEQGLAESAAWVMSLQRGS
jgi:nucleoside-diphosphate-sugar epimerase